jgi:multiple sugar transport system substrate-binding protein
MKFAASKKFIALISVVAMLFAAEACGSPNESTNTADASSNKQVEITVWAWEPTLTAVVKKFEAANPDIKVNLQNVGTNTKEYVALDNALQANSGAPDIAQIEYYAMDQYAINEQLKDITDDASDYSGFYTPGTWSSVQWNGKIYGLPMDSGPMAFFYNKEVFDKAGVDGTQIKTWDDYYQAAKKIKEATGDYITSDSGDAGFFDSMCWLAGGMPYKTSSNSSEVSIDMTGDKGTQTWITFWQRMIDEGLVDTKTAGWSEDWFKGLGDGSIASLFTGAWMPANLANSVSSATGKWRVAQMPTADGPVRNSENGGSSLAIMASTKKAAAAYKFIEYSNHDAAGVKTRVQGGAFPADVATLKSDDFLNTTTITNDEGKKVEYFGGQKYNEELAKAAQNVSTDYQFLPFEVYARKKYGDYLGKSYTNGASIADGVSSWQKDLKNYAENQGFTVK